MNIRFKYLAKSNGKTFELTAVEDVSVVAVLSHHQ